MKKMIFVMGVVLLSLAPRADAQVSVGIMVNAPPPPPRGVMMRGPGPRAGLVWIEGYWYPQGRHYRWRDGYWARAPYPDAYWISPGYGRCRFYDGYWNGPGRGRGHDTRWDRRDDRRGRDRQWDRSDDRSGQGRDNRRDDRSGRGRDDRRGRGRR